MSYTAGNSSIDEHGNTTGGSAGDQKQSSIPDWNGEVKFRTFPYSDSRGFYVLRPKDATHAYNMACCMIKACNNANIGYNQNSRDGVVNQGVETTTKCNSDCSSLIRACVKEGTGKDPGDFNTSSEPSVLANSGLFESKFTYGSQTLYNGDVLVTRSKGHTLMIVNGSPRSGTSETNLSLTSGGVVASGTASSISTQITVPTYSLSSSDLSFLAWVCQREQGSVTGAKAEASLIANRFEMYGSKYSSIANYVRNCGWWASYSTANPGTPKDDVLAGVKDVLVNGNRTLPTCIDEHDCLSDIQSISTGSVRNRSDYIQNETIIKNRYSSTYTFWCFPTSTSDPFGYTEGGLSKRGGIYMPGDYTSGATVNGNGLYPTMTTRNDSIIREVCYWSNDKPTMTSGKIRCSVINYTTAMNSMFEGTILSSSSSGSTSNVDMSGMTDTNARAIMTEFLNMGYTAASACGIMGNMYQESRLKPDSQNSDGGGLCGWSDFPSKGVYAFTNMKKYVGSNWANNLTGQVKYVDYTDHGKDDFPNIYSELQSYPNTLAGAKQACELFLRRYEQPGHYDTEVPLRNGWTEDIWNQIVLIQ